MENEIARLKADLKREQTYKTMAMRALEISHQLTETLQKENLKLKERIEKLTQSLLN